MITANVKIFGDRQDEFGMPVPYNSYFVVASPWKLPGSGVASLVSLSDGVPMPDPPHKIVTNGGPEQAFQDIIAALRTLPDNQGLTELIDRE